MTNSGLDIGAIDVGGAKNPMHHDSGAMPALISYAINFERSEANSGSLTERYVSSKSASITATTCRSYSYY